jgi:hypothetical protein
MHSKYCKEGFLVISYFTVVDMNNKKGFYKLDEYGWEVIYSKLLHSIKVYLQMEDSPSS